jgi:hypothetical protein
MATNEERESARRRLDIHRRNLHKLLEQASNYTDGVPIHISNQIDEQRVNIAALEPIAEPPTHDDTQLFVARVGDGNGGNWAMLFSQFVLVNVRLTKVEEQNQRILEEQARARIERMSTSEDVMMLKEDTEAGVWGRQRNFWMFVGSIAFSLAALSAALWLVFR